jgi:cyclase
MQKITDGLYLEINQRSSNNGIINTSEGVVLIDTPMIPEIAIRLRDEVKQLGPVKYIVNTEPHHDHFNGNCFFEGAIISHEGTRDAVLSAQPGQLADYLKHAFPDAKPIPGDFVYRPPTITIKGDTVLHLGHHTIEILYLPGHTPYQLGVFVPEEKVLFASDNIVRDITYLHQALIDRWFETLNRMESLDAKIVVPGHGELCDHSYIAHMRKILNAWVDAARSAMKRGLSQEEAQREITMEEYYPRVLQDSRLFQVKNLNIQSLYRMYATHWPL